MGYPVRKPGRPGGDGSSTTIRQEVPEGVAFIRDSEDPNRGVRIHHEDADHEWVLLTRAGLEHSPSQARIAGETDGAANYLDITLPDEFVSQAGEQNDFDILVHRGEDSHTAPAVAASRRISSNAHRGGITVTAVTAGAAGNDITVVVQYSQHALAAARYTSATRLVLTVSESATVATVVAAINGARHNGQQIVTASPWLNANSDAVGYLAIGGHPLQGGRDAVVSAREPLAFEYAPTIGGSVNTEAFLLTCLPTDALEDIKAVVEEFNWAAHEPFASSVTLVGSGADTIADSLVPDDPGDSEETIDFSGGTDPAAPSFAVDGSAMTVTATWSSIHSLADLVDAATGGVEVDAVPDTFLPSKPAAPPETIPFDFDSVGEAEESSNGGDSGAAFKDELLGDPRYILYSTGQIADPSADLATAHSLLVGVDAVQADRLRLSLGTSVFEWAVFDWLRLRAQAAGDSLDADADPATGLVVRETGGSATTLVGRTEGNAILVQADTWDGGSSAIAVQQRSARYRGGLLDLRTRESAGSVRICMVTRSAARPANPANVFYDGDTAWDFTDTWRQAGTSVPAGNDTLWFAFGEARGNDLSNLWDVQDSWIVVDATDTAAAIQYGVDWQGPWSAAAYDVIQSRYARIATATGSQIVRRVGNDRTRGEREWVPIARAAWTGWDQTVHRIAPFITFRPDEYRLLRLDMWKNGNHAFVRPIDRMVLLAPIDADVEPSILGGGQTWGAWFNERGGSGFKQHWDVTFVSGSTRVNRANINFYGSDGVCSEIILFNRINASQGVTFTLWVY